MAGKGNMVFKTEWYDCFQAVMFRNKVGEKNNKSLVMYNLQVQKKYYDRRTQMVKYSKIHCNKREFEWFRMCLKEAASKVKKYW